MNEDLSSHRNSAPGMPRWVKVFGIIAILLILFIITLHLTSNAPSGHTLR
jgi:hypothetical protein